MKPGLFAPDEFDGVCLFQVFDHLCDPSTMLDEGVRVLKPGGLVLAINHNIEAFSASVLGERSPIVDIEHTYLYSPATMSRLVREHGFEVCLIRPVLNRYNLYYLCRLLPLPSALKHAVLSLLQKTGAGQVRVSLPLGNLRLLSRKQTRRLPSD